MKIAIVGGGASGLMLASILSDYNKSLDITIFEKLEHAGKKLLATGNGKCNFSNANINKECYNNEFGYNIAKSFDTNKYFNDHGLLTFKDEEGRFYPISATSNLVLDILRGNISNVNIKCNYNIIRITKDNNKYILINDKGIKATFDIVVLAMGGKTLYKEANGHLICSMLNHSITPMRPTLIGLKVEDNLSSIANLRAKVKASLYIKDELIYSDYGEVLFKNDGISGIVMFQLSSIMARDPLRRYSVSLDLLPNMSEEEIITYLNKFNNMTGMFPKMINQFILKRAQSNDPVLIAKQIKNLRFNVIDTYDFKNAQVTSGGVNIKDVDENLESKANKNLYIMGELLDVDGICGGYNLQFAFASANVVALDILRKINE